MINPPAKRLLDEMRQRHRSPRRLEPAESERLELVLRLPDGEPWILSFSAKMRVFVGRYPRVEGIGPEDTLLAFSRSPQP